MNALKKKIHHCLNTNSRERTAIRTGFVISVLILLSVLNCILETIPELHNKYLEIFYNFEIFFVALFGIEYILRIWSCTVDPHFSHPLLGRLKFAIKPLLLLDLLAIIPSIFLLPTLDLRFLRLLRVLRFIQTLKIARYSIAFQAINIVIKKKIPEVYISISIGLTLLIFSASLMYFMEHEAQPDKFSSIPATMWWGIITLTTVGYGDIYPITNLGKFLGAIIAVIGVGTFALPAAIIASGFTEAVRFRVSHETDRCPHCGAKVE